ncbi:hypothetical protein ACF0H5_001579 [Mactra antiquata]
MAQINFNSNIGMDYDLISDLNEMFSVSTDVPELREEDFLPKDFSSEMKMILGILYSFFCIGAFLGNISILSMIVTNRSLRTVTNTFILSLTVSDLLVSCWNMPMQLIFYLKNEWTFGETVCKLTSYINGVCIATSILALVSISIERYHVICNPIKARLIRSTKSALLTLLSIWVLSALIMLPQLWIQRQQQRLSLQVDKYPPIRVAYLCVEVFPKFEYNILYSFVFFLILYVLPVVVMTYAYGKMAKVLWVRSHIGNEVISPQLSDKREIQRRSIIRMLIVVVLCYIFCWLPFFSMHVIILFIEFTNTVRIIQAFALLAGYMNSFINPFVYFFLNAKLQRVFKKRCSAVCESEDHKSHTPLKATTQITQM